MPLADPVVLGEGPCVAWGQFVDAGLFVSNVRARVSGCLERQRGAAQFSSRCKGQEGISRAGQEGPGRVRHTAVCRRWDWEPGRSTNSEKSTEDCSPLFFCSRLGWGRDGTLERGSAVDQGHVVGNRRGGGAGLAVVVRQTNEAPGCPGQSRNAERGKGRDEPLKMYVGRKNGGPKV